MNFEKAKRIEELRTGKVMHSFRRIAEIIEEEYPSNPALSGNQLHGMDLVKDAIEFIYKKKLNELSDEIRTKWDR